jgi:NAD-dependent deacetylase
MSDVKALAQIITEARNMVAFTGAGMSTESGIEDYRSPGGLWSCFKPPAIQEFLADEAARERYWEFYQATFPAFEAAQPNPGHLALGRLYKEGRLNAVITQNIDGLHIRGGVAAEDVLELHGNSSQSACLACGNGETSTADLLEAFKSTGQTPVCPHCGGPMKPRTISFGQSLDSALLERAAQLATQADLMLVMGSSLMVTPAADLPRNTLQAGGGLVILNRDPTHLDGLAKLVLRTPAGATLAQAVDEVMGASS